MKLRITKGRTLSRRALDNTMRKRLPLLGDCGKTLDIGGKSANRVAAPFRVRGESPG